MSARPTPERLAEIRAEAEIAAARGYGPEAVLSRSRAQALTIAAWRSVNDAVAEIDALTPVLEAARAWAAAETAPLESAASTGVSDWSERREAARAALLAAVEASR